MAHFILAAVGSSGDINPFLGIAAALRERGHQVTLLSAPPFEAAAASVGAAFVGLGSREAYEAIYEDPDLWHPRRGLGVYFGYLAGLVEETARAIEERFEPGRTVVASAFQCFGARVAHEASAVPLCTVLPYPVLLQSVHDPNRNPIANPPRWLGPRVAGLMYRVANAEVSRHVRDAVRAARRVRGLEGGVHDVVGWAYSPERILGLWPALLAGPQPDWPEQTRLTGFVSYDGPSSHGWTPPEGVAERSDWLVFTPGTQMTHGSEYFRVACEAAASLGHPTLMVAGDRRALPDTLPDNVTHLDFAPFTWLFERAAVVVHHGGIGTAARALTCGARQLIIPRGFDQFDNASRVARLGAGVWLSRKRLTGPKLAGLVARLLADEEMGRACQEVRDRLAEDDGLERACRELEAVAAP